MRKTAVILLIALSIYTLAACSGDTAKAAAEAAAGTAEQAAVEAAAATAAQEAAETAADTQASGTTDPSAINAIVAALETAEPEVLGTIVKMGEYKGLALTAAEHVTVTGEEVDAYLEENVLPSFTEEVTDAIKEGDVANIDYEGKKDGVAFDGGTGTGYDLEIGSGTFIDGFEDGLIGKKAGETVDLKLTFPENYQAEELAGKEVVFTVKINSVTRQRELTDALAQEIDPESKTVADLKASTQKALQKSQDLNEKQELYYNAVQAVLDSSEVQAAEEAITYTINSYVKNYADSVASSYGIDFGTLLSYYGASYEDFVDSYREYANSGVAQRILLQEIAKKENLTVTDADVEAFADSYGYTAEGIKEAVGEELVKELVLEDLANKFIVDNAVITYEKAEE